PVSAPPPEITESPLLPVAAVVSVVDGPASCWTLSTVWACTAPATLCVDCTSTPPEMVEPTRLLPVAVVTAVVSLDCVTTSSCCEPKTSPDCTWLLTTVDWLVAVVHHSSHSGIAAIVPAIRVLACRGIVGFHIVVGRHEGARGACRDVLAERVGVHAGLGPGHAIEVGDHLHRGALDDRADAELQRLQRPFAGREVEGGVVPHLEEADADLMGDDLLLVGDDVHHLERAGVHQPQVEADVHHERRAAGLALEVMRVEAAAVELDAVRADVEVELGDAAGDVEVGAGHLAGQDAAVLGRHLAAGHGLV